MAQKKQPMAFMSYVRFDDKHEAGGLTEFRERLSAEVHMQTGEDFPIFQDRNDIKWGQNWKERIEEGLDEATFLIPIITPSFFQSPTCRSEVERFVERERELKRNDLILPVYYVGCPLLDDEEKWAADDVACAVHAHQWADWQDLRFEPFTSPAVGNRLVSLAIQIREALERTQGAARPGAERATGKTAVSRRAGEPSAGQAETESTGEMAERARGPAAKTEPPILVVDPLHRGDHPTISEAIGAANPGDRILVREGLYEEGLVIDKPLEIIGDGEADEIVVQATAQNALLFKTTMGRVVNLTLRQAGGGDRYCVNIAQGRLELEGCDIASESLACVGIHGGADPRLRRNRIHDGKQSGVYVFENGQGVLEDNDIFCNALSGVAIGEGGNPTLRRNRIHDGKQNGVFVYDNSQGLLEDNDIFGNALANVGISERGNPTLRRNRIHEGKQGGVFVYENGQGVLEDNDIFGNALAGVQISEGGNPTLRRNRIHNGKHFGVFVYAGGQGVLEDNDIFGNALSGVVIDKGGNATVRGNRINRNAGNAVLVFEGGTGTFEENDLRENASGPWHISEDSEPNVKRARNVEE